MKVTSVKRIHILQAELGKGGVAPVENVKISVVSPSQVVLGSWPHLSPDWYVQWIQIQMNRGDQFRCPVNAWMDPSDLVHR